MNLAINPIPKSYSLNPITIDVMVKHKSAKDWDKISRASMAPYRTILNNIRRWQQEYPDMDYRVAVNGCVTYQTNRSNLIKFPGPSE